MSGRAAAQPAAASCSATHARREEPHRPDPCARWPLARRASQRTKMGHVCRSSRRTRRRPTSSSPREPPELATSPRSGALCPLLAWSHSRRLPAAGPTGPRSAHQRDGKPCVAARAPQEPLRQPRERPLPRAAGALSTHARRPRGPPARCLPPRPAFFGGECQTTHQSPCRAQCAAGPWGLALQRYRRLPSGSAVQPPCRAGPRWFATRVPSAQRTCVLTP